MSATADLIERLTSHMGKAEVPDLLRDCRLAAAHIASLEADLAEAREIIEAFAPTDRQRQSSPPFPWAVAREKHVISVEWPKVTSYEDWVRIAENFIARISSLEAENARLVIARDNWKESHGRVVEGFMEVCDAVGVQFDAPEAVAYSINAKMIHNAEYDQRAAESEREALRVALEPFAKVIETVEMAATHFGADHRSQVPDDRPYLSVESTVTWGDFRRAARALSSSKGGK